MDVRAESPSEPPVDAKPDEDLRARLAVAEARVATLERSNRLIAALGRVSSLLQMTLQPGDVLDTLGAELRKLGVTAVVARHMSDADGEALVVRYGALDPPVLELLEQLTDISLEGFRLTRANFPLFDDIVDARRPLFLSDARPVVGAALPELPRALADRVCRLVGITPDVQAILLPLQIEERMLGMLGLWGAELQAADVPAGTIFAGQVAAALEVARLHEQLRAGRSEEQAALLRLSQALLGQTEVEAVVDHALCVIEGAYATDYGAVWLREDAVSALRLVGGRGWDDDVDDDATAEAGTWSEHVLRNGTPVPVRDFGAEGRFAREALLAAHGVQSGLAVPLSSGSGVLGVLGLYWDAPHVLSDEQTRLLMVIANDVALALERAWLIERAQRSAARQRSLVETAEDMLSALGSSAFWPAVTAAVRRTLAADRAAVIVDPAAYATPQDDVRLGHASGLSPAAQTALDRLIATDIVRAESEAEPTVVGIDGGWRRGPAADALREALSGEGAAVGASFPLVAPSDRLGAIVAAWDHPRMPDEDQLAIGQTLAHIIGIAVQTARWVEADRQRVEELEVLAGVSAALRAADSVEDMLGPILHTARSAVGGSVATVFLADPESDKLVVRGCLPSHPDVIGAAQPAGTGITGHVAATGEPYLSRDLHADPLVEVPDAESPLLEEVRSTVSLPLRVGERTVGVLHIGFERLQPVPDDTMHLLTTLAEVAGNALHRASLLETLEQRVAERSAELQRKNRELAAVNERLTELDRLKSKFVSDVSHELRTPVTNISMYLHLLEHGRPSKRERYLAVLREQTERLTELVDDILDVTRLDAGAAAVEPVAVNDVVLESTAAQRALAEAGGLVLDVAPGHDLPRVAIQPAQLTKVVSNLVQNGLLYTEEGEVRVRTRSAGGGVVIEVEDSGPGIDAADQPHIYDRFYRGQAVSQSDLPGSGLGLAIVKEVVELYGGHVRLTSAPGQGSTFRVWLPAAETTPSDAPSDTADADGPA